ncbi:hypothetical protein RHMOL_Rhmol06G0183500 [Rhododendron molle]|uniref:Uncharacterized protein n=1 Tax=Rhododendron molle TaxID=49168 RepID=A0ACC0NDJ1_RHOML|nr:hypothetical protein RHMOL_Rhmol06G0183500 [Rhododendron molle]
MGRDMASGWGGKISRRDLRFHTKLMDKGYLGWIILRGELFHSGTDFLASVSDFAENQKTQDPEGKQFYAEENPEVGAEPEYAWDPYQT